MAKFRINSIAELSRQLGFTPQEARLAQLDSAETLLSEIDPARAYPVDFVTFRITGFRPKKVDPTLLAGLALQHDLGLLIETVSQTLDLSADKSRQPVLTIEDVGQRFGVTSKTIQRWRRRGLAARIFVFHDGKRRVGFRLFTVERFFAAQRDQTGSVGNFSEISETERALILRHARRMAESGRSCAEEIARRIGRRTNRSPLAITHIVKNHDIANPDRAIFANTPAPLATEARGEILASFRTGVETRQLSRQFGRSVSEISRIIFEERLARLNRRRVRFIDDPLYHQPDAAQVIEQIAAAPQAPIGAKIAVEQTRSPRDLPPYLADLYRTPLLAPAMERALFLKFNFHKYQFVTARRRLDPETAGPRDLARLESLRRKIVQTRNRIVQANLRLVVSVARRHLRAGMALMELVSEGNLTLIRSVDSFDIHKGNRFSTYATLALMKGFARAVPQMQIRDRRAAGTGADEQSYLETVPDRRAPSDRDGMLDREQITQLLGRLDPREQDVIRAHYGLGTGSPATYEQVGTRMGLSKQRVRQIEQAAFAKLRTSGHV